MDQFASLPGWLKNPETPVIAWGHSARPNVASGQLSLINANTGEVLDLPVSGIGYFLWVDNQHIAFLGGSSTDDLRSMRVIDLQTGEISIVDLSQRMIEEGLLRTSTSASPLTWRGKWMDSDQFFLISPPDGSFFSHDGRYKECVSGMTAELWICDLLEGTTIPLTTSTDGYYDRGTAWSPTASLIAELQESSPPAENDLSADRIAVYSAVSRIQVGLIQVQADIRRSLVDPSTGGVSNLLWSPDGERILYRDITGRLCFTPRFGGRSDCMPNGLADEREDTLSYVGWSASGDQVRYVSCDDASKTSSIDSYDISTRELVRIDDGMLSDADRVIIDFVPSPDDRLFFLVDDTRCYDLQAGVAAPRIGIFRVDDRSYTPVRPGWPDWLTYDGAPGLNLLWRPAAVDP